MPKNLIKQYLPDPEWLRSHKHLALLGDWIHNPNLWHLNRNSVARGFSVGLFCAFVPIPLQMVLAALLAIVFRANLPLAVTLVWITNPLTMPAIFYFAYKLGNLMIGQTTPSHNFTFSIEFAKTHIASVWKPFLLGCFTLSLFFATVSNMCIRIIWRLHVMQRWIKRRKARSQ